jgi:hypothetical protein
MPLPRRPSLALAPARPGWLTAGMVRLGLLSLFVIAIGMIRGRLTTTTAWVVVGIGAALSVIGLLVLLGATRRLEERLKIPWPAEAFVLLLRRIGLPLVGLAFFLAWTVVYVALWAIHPEEAFTGLAEEPRFADFFYYAVTTALISPPGDIFAASRGARSATMIEIMTGLALLTTYLSTLFEWRRGQQAPPT